MPDRGLPVLRRKLQRSILSGRCETDGELVTLQLEDPFQALTRKRSLRVSRVNRHRVLISIQRVGPFQNIVTHVDGVLVTGDFQGGFLKIGVR